MRCPPAPAWGTPQRLASAAARPRRIGRTTFGPAPWPRQLSAQSAARQPRRSPIRPRCLAPRSGWLGLRQQCSAACGRSSVWPPWLPWTMAASACMPSAWAHHLRHHCTFPVPAPLLPAFGTFFPTLSHCGAHPTPGASASHLLTRSLPLTLLPRPSECIALLPSRSRSLRLLPPRPECRLLLRAHRCGAGQRRGAGRWVCCKLAVAVAWGVRGPAVALASSTGVGGHPTGSQPSRAGPWLARLLGSVPLWRGCMLGRGGLAGLSLLPAVPCAARCCLMSMLWFARLTPPSLCAPSLPCWRPF